MHHLFYQISVAICRQDNWNHLTSTSWVWERTALLQLTTKRINMEVMLIIVWQCLVSCIGESPKLSKSLNYTGSDIAKYFVSIWRHSDLLSKTVSPYSGLTVSPQHWSAEGDRVRSWSSLRSYSLTTALVCWERQGQIMVFTQVLQSHDSIGLLRETGSDHGLHPGHAVWPQHWSAEGDRVALPLQVEHTAHSNLITGVVCNERQCRSPSYVMFCLPVMQ